MMPSVPSGRSLKKSPVAYILSYPLSLQNGLSKNAFAFFSGLLRYPDDSWYPDRNSSPTAPTGTLRCSASRMYAAVLGTNEPTDSVNDLVPSC